MSKWLGVILGGALIVTLVVTLAGKNPKDFTQDQKVQVSSKLAALQIPFIKNEGQINPEVSFHAQTFAGTLFVTKTGELVYAIRSKVKGLKDQGQRITDKRQKTTQDPRLTTVLLKESFQGAKTVKIKGEKESITKVNSFIGNDSSKWQTNIATYSMVSLGEIYEGIELKLKAYEKNVEKLFFIKPGIDPQSIRIKLEGAKEIQISEKGELIVTTQEGDIRFTKPVAYQKIDGKRIEVEAAYRIEKMREILSYSFKVGAYHKNHTLVIDPLLASTYIGGSEGDSAYALAVDSEGYVYVAGDTPSSNFPYASPSLSGEYDVFISKLDSNMTQILLSSFIGGNSRETAKDLVLDSDAGTLSIFMTGVTSSSDYPTTTGVYSSQKDPSLYADAFITKLNSGLSIVASTFLGGGDHDGGKAIAIDPAGDVYVGGVTISTNFPTNIAYRGSNSGQKDGFLAKLDTDLTTLLNFTYMGGSANDEIFDLAINPDGDVFATGETYSADFITFGGSDITGIDVSDTTLNGNRDAFVSKLDNELSTLEAFTFLGGQDLDSGLGIVIDSSGNIYVTGSTYSGDFPYTAGAYDITQGGTSDAFVSKFNKNLTVLKASTFLGGSNYDEGKAIAIDANGDIYLAGETLKGNDASDFPMVGGGHDAIFDGFYYEGYVAKLSNDLSKLYYTTFLGGTETEAIEALVLDSNGYVYVTGETVSVDFPVTLNGADVDLNGSYDVFVSKLTQGLSKYVDVPLSFGALATSPSTIVLSWKDMSKNERGFKIERKLGNCASNNRWSQKKIVGENVNTYIDRSRTAGTAYAYRVRGYNRSGNSAYSDCSYATTGAAGTPNSPSGFKALALSSTRIRFTWVDNSENEGGFKVMRSVPGTDISLTTTSANVTLFDATVASMSDPFYARAFVRNPVRYSPISSMARIPNKPQEFSTDVASSYSIDITWTDASENETGFQIYRKEGGCSADNPWVRVTTVAANKTSYSDGVVYADTIFGYKMRAYTRSDTRPFAYGYSQWTHCTEETAL